MVRQGEYLEYPTENHSRLFGQLIRILFSATLTDWQGHRESSLKRYLKKEREKKREKKEGKAVFVLFLF